MYVDDYVTHAYICCGSTAFLAKKIVKLKAIY